MFSLILSSPSWRKYLLLIPKEIGTNRMMEQMAIIRVKHSVTVIILCQSAKDMAKVYSVLSLIATNSLIWFNLICQLVWFSKKREESTSKNRACRSAQEYFQYHGPTQQGLVWLHVINSFGVAARSIPSLILHVLNFYKKGSMY